MASQRGLAVEGVPHAFGTTARCWPRCLSSTRSPSARRRRCATPSPARRSPPASTCFWRSRRPRRRASSSTSRAPPRRRGRTLFTTWHSQYNAGGRRGAARGSPASAVQAPAHHLEGGCARWHPGQEWIWQAGGFGVFDPGINALSIMTKILPAPVFVRRADLQSSRRTAMRRSPPTSISAPERARPTSRPPSTGARPAADLGHRGRDGRRMRPRLLGRRQPPRDRRQGGRGRGAGRISADLRALRRPVCGRASRRSTRLPSGWSRTPSCSAGADRRRAVRVLR